MLHVRRPSCSRFTPGRVWTVTIALTAVFHFALNAVLVATGTRARHSPSSVVSLTMSRQPGNVHSFAWTVTVSGVPRLAIEPPRSTGSNWGEIGDGTIDGRAKIVIGGTARRPSSACASASRGAEGGSAK